MDPDYILSCKKRVNMSFFVLFPYLPLGIHYQIFAFFFCADNCVRLMIIKKVK